MAESDAEKAYAAAQKVIELAQRNVENLIDLGAPNFGSLTRIPPEIALVNELRHLIIDDTQISDLSPLREIKNLESISLADTSVEDLSPLADLTMLNFLELSGTLASNLNPLKNLTNLHTLYLDRTPTFDLTPISKLQNLVNLSLNQTKVRDLQPLSGFRILKMLRLSDTKVEDIKALSGIMSLTYLNIDNTPISDLSPISEIKNLRFLLSSGTKVSDLAPLASLTELKRLGLAQTLVEDISPLQNMYELRSLHLEHTKVSDLRPIMRLGKLGSETYSELSFKGTPFARASYDLSRIAYSGYHRKRTRDTLAYLKTLPPWPEPLPWQKEPVTPEPDSVPTINASPSGIDLAHSPLDEVDKADPIKRRIYDKLPDAIAALLRHGNRYPEVKGPSDALRELVAVAFEDADLLDIHLQIAALTDVREQDQRKPAQERLDADCLTALNTVLRLGPPVTIGHPDVDLLEKRSAEYARNHLPESVPQGERRIAAGIEKAPEIAGERLRRVAGQVAKAPNEGRVAEYRRPLNRNMIIALASLTGLVGDAVVGYVPGEIVQAAAQFLWLHRAEIMSTAPAWGESGGLWLSYMLARAQEIADEGRQA